MLTFNGTSGFLEYADKLVSSYPCTMLVWGTRASSAGDQAWVAQQQSNGERAIRGYHVSSSDTKRATVIIPGNGDNVGTFAAPHTSPTVPRLMIVVFASATSKSVYFGDSVGATNTVSIADQLSSHDRVTVGALHYNSAAAINFANGALGEAHFFNVALTPGADMTALFAGAQPETIAGWVDGWSLKDFEASGNYVSIGGTRTLTAVGGITSSAVAHPVSRLASVSSDLVCSYGVSTQVSSDLACSYTIQDSAVSQVSSDLACAYGIISATSSDLSCSYTVDAPTGTFTSAGWYNYDTHTAWANEDVVYTWMVAGRIGEFAGKTLYEDLTATLNSSGQLVIPLLPLGPGILFGSVRGASYDLDKVYMEPGVVVA